jgi:hypothetical protein
VIVPKCSGGDSTAEPDIGILEAKIGGCDWEMHFDIRGKCHNEFGEDEGFLALGC